MKDFKQKKQAKEVVAKIKSGRKTKYDNEYHVPLAASFARHGCNQDEIGQKLGVDGDIIGEWIKEYPEFSQAITEGDGFIVAKIENALVKSALGYNTVEKTDEKLYNPKMGLTEKDKTVIKHVQPSVHAQIFFLKNRRPDMWKDKIESDDVAKGEKVFVWEEVQQSIMSPEDAAKHTAAIANAVKNEAEKAN